MKPIRPFKIGIIRSVFNSEITEKLLEGAMNELRDLDWPSNYIYQFDVPGAVELPLAAQRLAQQSIVDAIIVLGAVIQGETNHFDYVCEQVSQGCQKVMLDNDIPVVFGVLTTQTEEQAWDRVGGKHGHKGKETIQTAIEFVMTLDLISGSI